MLNIHEDRDECDSFDSIEIDVFIRLSKTVSVEVEAADILQAGIQGAPFMLPVLARRSTVKKRSAAAADLDERPDSAAGADEVFDDAAALAPTDMTMMRLRELRADLESRMNKNILLGSKKGVTSIRSRYSRNLADASDDPTQFDHWVRPDDESDSSDEDQKDDEMGDATAAAAASTGPPRRVSIDRQFCPVLQASGSQCKANYKHLHGKSMKKHALTHCPDGFAAEGSLLWTQFVRDGKVQDHAKTRILSKHFNFLIVVLFHHTGMFAGLCDATSARTTQLTLIQAGSSNTLRHGGRNFQPSYILNCLFILKKC